MEDGEMIKKFRNALVKIIGFFVVLTFWAFVALLYFSILAFILAMTIGLINS